MKTKGHKKRGKNTKKKISTYTEMLELPQSPLSTQKELLQSSQEASTDRDDSGLEASGEEVEHYGIEETFSSVFSDTEECNFQREKKSPFERYSMRSSLSLRQRAASEHFVSPTWKSILKQPEDLGRRKAYSFSHTCQKHVSFCEENNRIRVFSSDCGIDEQAARRKKNEKKRLYRAKRNSLSECSEDIGNIVE